MSTAFLLIVGIGTVATMVSFVALGVLSSRRQDEAEESRKLATHRRRVLLGMLEDRSTSAH